MKVKDIMITNVFYVSSGASISEVSDIIFKNRIHGVPVLRGRKVVGIITEDDFFLKNYDDLYLPSYIKFLNQNKVANNLPGDLREKIIKLLGTKAKDIMTKDPITVSPETDVTELMAEIKKNKFVTFPVTDQDKNMLGVVTLADVLGTVRKGSREMA